MVVETPERRATSFLWLLSSAWPRHDPASKTFDSPMGSSQHSRSFIIVVKFNSLSNWNAPEIGEFDSVTGLSDNMLLIVKSRHWAGRVGNAQVS